LPPKRRLEGKTKKLMFTQLSVRRQQLDPLLIDVEDGQFIFVLGANGTGKSSLMFAFFSQAQPIAHRILAHRQTWFQSSSLTMSARDRIDSGSNIRGMDGSAQSRYRDDYSTARTNIALYDLVEAENIRARGIAAAIDAKDHALATTLSAKCAPLKTINELLRLSNIPIAISVGEEVLATKANEAPYPIAELSDGERSAVLIAATVLTVPAGSLLLIDEPERHLHRSIISPLLTLLFKERRDCKFVVSTHDYMLAIDNPAARTLLVRSCAYRERHVLGWDVDLVEPNAEIGDEVKKNTLGARRKIIFVEGEDLSLDRSIYSLIFPAISVIAKRGCREVEVIVTGIRASPDAHWVQAFGIVDNDRRSPVELAALAAKKIFALPVHTIESIYYHPHIQQLVAERHAAVTGDDATTRVAAAKDAALAALAPHAARMSNRVIEKTVRSRIEAALPTQNQIATGNPVSLHIDVGAIAAAEMQAFANHIVARELEDLVCRYPVRETPALTRIAERLGFQDREQYEGAVRKLLADDAAALTFVRNLFGSLYSEVAG
jgi:ABC-type ATPase involved in cell division